MHKLVWAVASVVALASVAAAQPVMVVITLYNGTVLPAERYAVGAPITLNVDNTVETINIYSDVTFGPQTVDIGRITLSGTTDRALQVMLSQDAFPLDLATDPIIRGALAWDGITVSTGLQAYTRLAGAADGDLTGTVSVGEVFDLQFDGTIDAPIEATQPGPLMIRRVLAEFISANGHITATQGSIGEVESHVQMSGDVRAPNGSIASVSSSNIGPHSRITILAKDGINSIIAGYINADITTNANGGTGNITRLWTSCCEFSGSLTTHAVQGGTPGANGIDITSTLYANITVAQDVLSPIRVAAGVYGVITIGGELRDDATADGRITIDDCPLASDIHIGAAGLKGQITLNANDSYWPWLGNVYVGPITIGPLAPVPYYDQLSGPLGGGAVGLARFTYHALESSPQDDAVINSGPLYADMALYGPVSISGGFGKPVTVERRKLDPESQTWEDVTGAHSFEVIGSASRTVRVTPLAGGFRAPYEYRFTPVQDTRANRLLCSGVTGPPPAREGQPIPGGGIDPYSFSVPTEIGAFDLNGDRTLDSADIAAWPPAPVDLNYDEVADGTDYIELIDTVTNHPGPID